MTETTPKKKPYKMDMLDKVMVILAIILMLVGVAWYYGYGIYATATVVVLFSYAYFKAPRRTYPTAEEVAKDVDLVGKVALVTGPTSGIGVETARVLALQGAHVYLAGRNETKLRSVKDEMMKTLPQGSKLSTVQCDLSDLSSIKECATNFLKEQSKLDILINNAGIMAIPERRPTKQDLESQVGVCHVGHFYLTLLLLPALEKAAATAASSSSSSSSSSSPPPSRVVVLSSVAHTRQQMRELITKSSKLETVPYDGDVGYGNAKACNLLFANEFHQRYYTSKNICSFSVMPGGIFTGLQGHVRPWTMFKWTIVAPFFFKSIEQGAATSILCALKADPNADGGQYFDNCKVTDAVAKVFHSDGSGNDETIGKQLWDVTENLLNELGYPISS